MTRFVAMIALPTPKELSRLDVAERLHETMKSLGSEDAGMHYLQACSAGVAAYRDNSARPPHATDSREFVLPALSLVLNTILAIDGQPQLVVIGEVVSNQAGHRSFHSIQSRL
jgi:hypothetical protein